MNYLTHRAINLFDKEYPIHYIDYSTYDRYNFGDIGSDSILVVFGGRKGAETINTLSSSSAAIIFDLLYQTRIKVDDYQRIEQFMKTSEYRYFIQI